MTMTAMTSLIISTLLLSMTLKFIPVYHLEGYLES